MKLYQTEFGRLSPKVSVILVQNSLHVLLSIVWPSYQFALPDLLNTQFLLTFSSFFPFCFLESSSSCPSGERRQTCDL